MKVLTFLLSLVFLSSQHDDCKLQASFDSNELLLPIAIISDQDKKSRAAPSWYSTLNYGILAISKNQTSAFIHWYGQKNITSLFNYNGKAMENSDLITFNNNLLTSDDKLGIVYKIRNSTAIPWIITMSGDGSVNRPFKGEWMTERNGYLYLGSNGKELVTKTGEFVSDDEMFIRIITPDGAIRVEDWTARYIKVRLAVGIKFPGFMIHEAVQWSEVHQKWFFLPRYASKLPYIGTSIYASGSNYLISVSDCFCDFEVINIGEMNDLRGFSAFQFVPGTDDTLIAAIKTEEVPSDPSDQDSEKEFATFITVFHVNGTVILDDLLISRSIKYEGLAFVDLMKCSRR